ncbi:ATP-binding protein [Dactylosporangium sp. NPDC005555]|uniref:sensor histidine kinase n=1 Tax=Dactylosporangium sp. NPDC005555 TaxID=3154889 RepID=UPI0033A0E594
MDGEGGRIRWAREVRLPLALAAVQLLVWPLGPFAFGMTVDAGQVWRLTALTAVVAVALSLRSVAPVAAWAATLAAVSCASPLGLQDQALVVPFGDLFALYALAARRTLRVSVACAAAGTVVSTLVADVLFRPGPATGRDAFIGWDTLTGPLGDVFGGVDVMTAAADAVLAAVAYAAVVVFGRSRRRRSARSEAIRVHVAAAAEHERAAAAHERERLSRELHDVSAHHLTAVVVQLAAAQRLRDPASTAQALDVARTSGRAASRSLHHLVALAGRDDPTPPAGLAGLPDLVAGYARLGLRPRLRVDLDPDAAPDLAPDLDPDLAPDVGGTVHQIVREALTNALRYAPGAQVSVSVAGTAGAVTVTVDDDGAGGASGFDLGSGAGIPGMRARAARLGGTVTAGPGASGGWSVHAVLPTTNGVRGPGTDGPVTPVPATVAAVRQPGGRVLDGLLMLVVAGLPVFVAAVARAEEDAGPLFAGAGDAGMTALFLTVYCGALWWRRRAPVVVLAVMLAVALTGGIVARLVPGATGSGSVLPLALAGIVGAVYAVGRYETRHPALSWLAAVIAGVVGAVVLVVRFVRPADLIAGGGPPQLWPTGAVFVTGLSGAALSLLTVPWWMAGLLVARHHARTDRRDRAALRDVADRAVRAAREERARIADGLRDQVLRHTSALLESAGDDRTPAAGKIAVTLGHGRAALTAMRELLTVLRVGPAPRAAQPTLAGLADLTGVTLEVHGAGPGVPLEVELCAFRLVEAVLPVGGASLSVRIEHGPGALRLRVEGLGGPVPRPVLAALRERVDAVGGSLTPARIPDPGWRLEANLPTTEPDVQGVPR